MTTLCVGDIIKFPEMNEEVRLIKTPEDVILLLVLKNGKPDWFPVELLRNEERDEELELYNDADRVRAMIHTTIRMTSSNSFEFVD